MSLPTIQLADRTIGGDAPTFFIADLAANHDGDLQRAVDLIHLAARAGADAVKFQHFLAEEIVSDRGFADLGGQLSHQAKWKKSVVQVYREAALPRTWTVELKNACREAGIIWFSAPYDFEAVDMLAPHMELYKIGSGDITWLEIVERIASLGRPVFLATGASDLRDVQQAADLILAHTADLVLMQCNTNYTGSLENFRHIHLNVLKTYAQLYPDVVLGLSDHTPGHTTVLGAIALGARVIEKHFTDDCSREGPDHGFSMDPQSWREMVDRARELEAALGDPVKRVATNERETVIVQRRSLYAACDLQPGTVIERRMLKVLRPAPTWGIPADQIDQVIGKTAARHIDKGQGLRWTMLDDPA